MSNFEYSLEASKITFGKVSSWEELNAATMSEADQKFNDVTRRYWQEFAVSGVLQFDPKEGKQVLRPFTDLDGRCAIAILGLAGINTDKLTYVRPGGYLKGAINLDTGDRFGVVYEEPTYTAFFDHHAKGAQEVISTTEIVYRTMIDLEMIGKTKALDHLVDFVTKIDNRKFPAEEFLKSAKTILGLQRDISFQTLLEYFKDRERPTDELSLEELNRFGLLEASDKQQKVVNEAMKTLTRMEEEGKFFDSQYGRIVINGNNELRVGSAVAYVRFDGIVTFTPGKSFAVTLKDKDFNEKELKKRLGDRFQGKIIRGGMWIYNGEEPLKLNLDQIIDALK